MGYPVLREGDGDVVLFESGPNLLTKFAAYIQGFKGIAYRKFQFVGDGCVGKIHCKRLGCRPT